VATTPPSVHDRKSAVHFVRWCVAVIGLGYHPDDRFADYVAAGGRPTFRPKEAVRLEALAERAFAYCDPYEIGCAEFERLLGQNPGCHQPD
jgi:hypothetical protein